MIYCSLHALSVSDVSGFQSETEEKEQIVKSAEVPAADIIYYYKNIFKTTVYVQYTRMYTTVVSIGLRA
jgi:hypothetical protein